MSGEKTSEEVAWESATQEAANVMLCENELAEMRNLVLEMYNNIKHSPYSGNSWDLILKPGTRQKVESIFNGDSLTGYEGGYRA